MASQEENVKSATNLLHSNVEHKIRPLCIKLKQPCPEELKKLTVISDPDCIKNLEAKEVPQLNSQVHLNHSFSKINSIPFTSQYDVNEQKEIEIDIPVDSNKENSEQVTHMFPCFFCNMDLNFSFERAFIHYQYHLDYYPIKCSICTEVFVNLKNFFCHFKKVHPGVEKGRYIFHEDTRAEKWIKLYLEKQINPLLKQILPVTDYCPACKWTNRLDKPITSPSQANGIKIIQHIHKHLLYYPYECIKCKELGKNHYFPSLELLKLRKHMDEIHKEVTESQKDQVWEFFSKTNSLPSLDKFISNYLNSLGVRVTERKFRKRKRLRKLEIDETFNPTSLLINDTKTISVEKCQFPICTSHSTSPAKPSTNLATPLQGATSPPIINLSVPQVPLVRIPTQQLQQIIQQSPISSTIYPFSSSSSLIFYTTNTSSNVQPLKTLTKSPNTVSPIVNQLLPTSSYLKSKISTSISALVNNKQQISTFLENSPYLYSFAPESFPLPQDEGKFFCLFCSKKDISSKQEACEHYSIHLKYLPVLCLLCDNSFSSFDNLVSHFDQQHQSHRDNLLYVIKQNEDLERWIDQFLTFQKSPEIHALVSCVFGQACPVCDCLVKQPPKQIFKKSISQSLKDHIYSHLHYSPFVCLICKNNGVSTTFSCIDGKVFDHFTSVHHLIRTEKLDITRLFAKVNIISEIEEFIDKFLKNGLPFENSDIKESTSAQNEEKRKSSSNRKRTTFLLCFHCHKKFLEFKRLKLHHCKAHPALSLISYTPNKHQVKVKSILKRPKPLSPK